MSDTGLYRQCVLRKTGSTETTTWLPEKFAQIGRGVSLKKPDGSWDDGWHVVKVGDARVAHDRIHDREWKKHRERTDI